MYQACTNTATLVDAGGRGIGALVLGFGGPDEVAAKNDVYRAAFADRRLEDQVGYAPNEHLAALCPAVVLEDGAEARRLGLRGQRFFLEAIAHWAADGTYPLPDPDSWIDGTATTGDGTEIVSTRIGAEMVSVDFSDSGMSLLNPNHAYGTVDDCIGYVERLVEAGADEILFLNQMGTVPQWAMLETVRNIGEHVIPRFR